MSKGEEGLSPLTTPVTQLPWGFCTSSVGNAYPFSCLLKSLFLYHLYGGLF